jgi:hypothetical protein
MHDRPATFQEDGRPFLLQLGCPRAKCLFCSRRA